MEQTQKKPRTKLTKKQRGFVEEYLKEENGAKAVMKHYNVKDNIVAKSIASENLTKPYIVAELENRRKSLKDALIEQGITESKIAEKIDVLLTAVDKEGKSDYAAIDKGLKHATNIYGITDEPPKDTKNTYNFFFNKEVQEEVKNLEDRIKTVLIQKRNDKEN